MAPTTALAAGAVRSPTAPAAAAAPARAAAAAALRPRTRVAASAVAVQQQQGLLVPNSAAAREAAAALRKHLVSAGFQDAWADGVASELRSGRMFTTPERAQAALDFLASVGVPPAGAENMASLCKEVLAAPVDAQRAVVAYLEARGVAGADLVRLLEAHPAVLTYAVAADGSRLERGAARAAVVFADRGGRRVAGVQLWREGCAFETAPVSPTKP